MTVVRWRVSYIRVHVCVCVCLCFLCVVLCRHVTWYGDGNTHSLVHSDVPVVHTDSLSR